ncbi:protein STICHEL-like 4 [Hordeum vulgare subsp. vulgare]|uniref:protein STICHEL-like 4 n=1 Tax=Hordeum vulgare subsp. vulgare TaxID=112509 RepID=UPI000B469B2D|nr:protein STICHEL-like 4 [Hordeum vulgare subsp. vulgare]
MVVGLLTSEDGGRLAGARVGHHGAGLLPVVPGPGGGLTGDAEEAGLISDDKLVDLLDLALSADTANTVKALCDIAETGVEPLSLMSQLATIIIDILAGTTHSHKKEFEENSSNVQPYQRRIWKNCVRPTVNTF